jgi:hypothetical protein
MATLLRMAREALDDVDSLSCNLDAPMARGAAHALRSRATAILKVFTEFYGTTAEAEALRARLA